MAALALSMRGVGKQYRLGVVGTGTLAHDLNRWMARMLGHPDPYARVGVVNDRTRAGGEYVWAVEDIHLDVTQGQIVGIIGKNGAGKSTLLKLLSRVTAPTRGEILVRGRIASLLEVGTGFHPELTGRENIHLNGAILGMSRREIRSRFDEIVEFSGVAKYVDTPVKRYSSGMYVRLAFAVAAHLEPEILIVDEVLAVGDAEFQARCLGKMKDVSDRSGRTVLFVSHNMAAVKQLCPDALLLHQGRIVARGPTADVVAHYTSLGLSAEREVCHEPPLVSAGGEVRLHRLAVGDAQGRVNAPLDTGLPVTVMVDYALEREVRHLRVALSVLTPDGVRLFAGADYDHQGTPPLRPAGRYRSQCLIPAHLLNGGPHVCQVDFEIPRERGILMDQRVAFTMEEMSTNGFGPLLSSHPPGLLHPRLDWRVTRMDPQPQESTA
ncbi:MAG: ABC transporter ATP-binding protein [Magnetococcus sp. WYHC-3]